MINYNKLVEDLIQKDQQAFNVIYEHTNRGVFAMIISLVNNKAATEDLMQDTYMKMVQKIRQYKKGRNFVAWLLQIAKNTAYDYLRKEKRLSVLDPQEHNTLFEGSYEDKHHYEVLDMVKDLDADEKQVVLLRVISDLKYKEIAKIMDKPLGTVLWLYQKAIKKLQEIHRKE